MSKHPMFPAENLVAYRMARQLLVMVVQLTEGWPRGWSDLKDQARRAAQSGVLNIAEGAARAPGSAAKANHYEVALGSVDEVGAVLDSSMALNLSSERDARRVLEHARHTGAVIGGLHRSARRKQPRR